MAAANRVGSFSLIVVQILVVLIISVIITVEAATIDDYKEFTRSCQSTTISPVRANLPPIFREARNHGDTLTDEEDPTRSSIFDESHREHDANRAQATDKLEQDDATLVSVQMRLMKELREITKGDSHKRGIINVELEGDNLRSWNVKLFVPEGPLHGDLMELKSMGRQDHILLRITFGDNFPEEPPYVRIVYPVLDGTYIFSGGALCMDILTKHGWNSSSTIEGFILTILSGFVQEKVRVEFSDDMEKLASEYSEENALHWFNVVKQAHEQGF